MTRFWREGFWRKSQYGVPHWVTGHWVERDDWDRFGEGPSSADYWRGRLDSLRARSSSTARFLSPNATCPVCGVDVYFYQNEHGSRVYFDEVGPPWPKHPCTDSAGASRRSTASRQPQAPAPRQDDEIIQINEWTNAAYLLPDSRFSGRYGHKPWPLAQMLKRIRGRRGTFFVLRDLTEGSSRKLFMAARSLPRSLSDGTVVAVERGRISYLDLGSMLPREITVTRFHSPSAFIDAMIDGGSGA
jgi:hypothetical protein